MLLHTTTLGTFLEKLAGMKGPLNEMLRGLFLVKNSFGQRAKPVIESRIDKLELILSYSCFLVLLFISVVAIIH